MTHVAEIVTFSLANGTSQEEFVKLSQASEAFVRAAPGFVHRQLSMGSDGRWTDYVVWTDANSAKDAAEQFMHQDCAAAMMAAIDPENMEMRHEHVLWKMNA
ncbi:hypothetical protein [Ruegeria arenilitoris]|uniref:hypothetical protein n=1 Tax=Ruegeria arenilitoris TaxID=1173585 RepID=UPI001479D7B0|nr:hypothetical protein [Ruegeria arenilitoris]